MKSFNEYTIAEWFGLAFSIVCTAVGVTAYAYSEFVLKEAYKDDKQEIMRRLERIETKVDEIREKRR